MRKRSSGPSTAARWAALRTGFTMVEVAFVMIVASVIMMVMLNILRNINVGAAKAEAKLDYLRQATILLDRVRGDIRSAGRGDSVQSSGAKVTIRREAPGDTDSTSGGGEMTVTYEYDPEKRVVVCTTQGGSRDETTTYGQGGPGKGFIVAFDVGKRTPSLPGADGQQHPVSGFYSIKLAFATELEVKEAEEKGVPIKASNTFMALVSKRAPEVADDLWKPNN